MVAVGDFGVSEREDMVRLALSRGWIDGAEQMGQANGVEDPVVVLVAVDALDLLPFRFNRSTRNRAIERIQRNAGCKRFVVGVSSYASLLAGNAAQAWHEDMEEMRRKGGVSVVVFNRTGHLLASITRVEAE